MLNPQPQGGWGAGTTTAAPMANPFASLATPPAANPFTTPANNNPFLQTNATSSQTNGHNPFASPPSTKSNTNPFANASNPPTLKRSASPSTSQPPSTTQRAINPFDSNKRANVAQPRPSTPAFGTPSAASSNTDTKKVAEFVQPAWPKPSISTPQFASQPSNSTTIKNSFSKPTAASKSGHGSAKTTKSATPKAVPENHNGRSFALAEKIKSQLAKDRIYPPKWPVNPGSSPQRNEMEAFRESYKAYREKVRKSLIRAGLIDDPDQRRTLAQALDFRGISDDMCPEWERITRIVEFDTRNPEKQYDESGELVVIPSLMVKRLARSAAGQDAPLPMDVRSFATLRRTLDYLIDDLIPADDDLPAKHNFLWDRTRAIRIDLSVQKYNLTPDERTDLVYCLETIARFHVTSLHLLSQDGFAAEDFSEQQEIEQLGKTLMSLKELYDDCVEQGIECPNEAEFRGYYVVFNAHNPSTKETVEGWGLRLWNTNEIRTAMCLVESIQNTWSLQGPLSPYAPTDLALSAAAIFFTMVSSPQISYTMACFAEIHFNSVRKSMLQVIKKSYSRPRDGPKDITPAFLKDRLRFDSEQDAIDYADKFGFQFGNDGANKYLILNSRQAMEDARIRHPFSQSLVECKRSGHSLPDIIRKTVFQVIEEQPQVNNDEEERLFVSESDGVSVDAADSRVPDSDTESLNSPPPATNPVATDSKPPSSPFTPPTPHPTHAAASPSIFGQSGLQPLPSGESVIAKPSTPSTFESPNNVGTSNNIFGKSQSSSPLVPFIAADNAGIKTPFTVGSSTSGQTPEPSSLPKPDTTPLSSNRPSSLFSFLNQSPGDASKPTKGQSPSNSLATSSPSPSMFQKASASGTSPFPATVVQPSNSQNSNNLSAINQEPNKNAVVQNGASFVDKDSSPILSENAALGTQSLGGKASASQSTPPFILAGTSTVTHTASPNIPDVNRPAAMVTPQKDPMGDFTRWFVLGDRGLMQTQLEPFVLEHILQDTWNDFRATEDKRIQDEEDERLEAQARDLRKRNLQIKYFYRWVDTFRKRRVVKRIQMEKEKARKWRSAESVAERKLAATAKKERALKEAKELVEKRTKERADESRRFRESTQSRQSLEEALLSTGVLNGVRDEQAAARSATRTDDGDDSESSILPATKLRLRSENQRRRTRGLPPLKRFPEPAPTKEGSKTAKLRALAYGAGRSSFSMSTGSLRNSTFSSSYRSSLGFNHGRVSKPRSNITDPYWRMKANGLVQMPNGEYLHESLALPMLHEGKRYPGFGNYGLPDDGARTPSQSPQPLVLDSESPLYDIGGHGRGLSESSSVVDGVRSNRKRTRAERADDDDLAAYRSEAPASRKRTKSGGETGTPAEAAKDEDFLASIDDLLKRVEAVKASAT
ncbi:hypothetical protein F5Y16DRAFT_370793 [Xylariaceae sp. FL0255]|nr:hypothetical protein F5Y16DRAFT_370793 [Xylariaceae sp. FL0255]